MKILKIAEIKKKFPNPVKSSSRSALAETNSYCVGGALCKSAGISGISSSFPCTLDLSDALKLLNPRLKKAHLSEDFFETANRTYARRIIKANDDGDFELAWKLAEEALSYKDKPVKK